VRKVQFESAPRPHLVPKIAGSTEQPCPLLSCHNAEMLTTTKMDAHKRSEVGMRNSTPEHFARSESEQLVELQTAALQAAPNAIVITDREAKIV
jgi:hypothetical protein